MRWKGAKASRDATREAASDGPSATGAEALRLEEVRRPDGAPRRPRQEPASSESACALGRTEQTSAPKVVRHDDLPLPSRLRAILTLVLSQQMVLSHENQGKESEEEPSQHATEQQASRDARDPFQNVEECLSRLDAGCQSKEEMLETATAFLDCMVSRNDRTVSSKCSAFNPGDLLDRLQVTSNEAATSERKELLDKVARREAEIATLKAKLTASKDAKKDADAEIVELKAKLKVSEDAKKKAEEEAVKVTCFF